PLLQQHVLRNQSLSSSAAGSLQQSALPQSTPDRSYSSATLSHRTAAKVANTLKRSASLAVTLKSYIPSYSSSNSNSSDAFKQALADTAGSEGLGSGLDTNHLSVTNSRQIGGVSGRTGRNTGTRPRSVHGDAGYVQAQST